MKSKRIVLIILLVLALLLLLELILRPEVFRNSLASALFNGERYQKAAELYAANGDDSTAKANLGKALYKEGRAEEAQAAFDEALANSKAKAELYYDRGNAAFANKDYQAAVENYTESLLLDSGDKDAKANLELALRKLLENPPPPQQKQNEDKQQDRSEEEVRNILEALDNKEAQDRKEQQTQAPQRSENWW